MCPEPSATNVGGAKYGAGDGKCIFISLYFIIKGIGQSASEDFSEDNIYIFQKTTYLCEYKKIDLY